MALRDVRLVERVDGDGVGEGGRGTTGGGGALEGPRSMAAAILSRLEEMRPRGRSNIAIKTAIHTLPHPRQLPLQHFKSGLLELQEGVVLRSSNAATACSGSGP